jgi:hypothetical protein
MKDAVILSYRERDSEPLVGFEQKQTGITGRTVPQSHVTQA